MSHRSKVTVEKLQMDGQTDGWMEATALPPTITWSVTSQEIHHARKEVYDTYIQTYKFI